jgi:hypothetical protein
MGLAFDTGNIRVSEASIMSTASPPRPAVWPDERTLIPDLLHAAPGARAPLDRYGLRGCGGPNGPVETLGFFARAHDVPIAGLLSEIREAIRSKAAEEERDVRREAAKTTAIAHDSATARQPAPAKAAEAVLLDESPRADTIYRPFFKAGMAVVLSLGAVWGAYLLWRIGWGGSFASAGVQEINAHGHAQIFGWVGLFVMGFAYQAFPRFKHASLAHPRCAMATLWLMLAGIVGRSIGQVLAAANDWAWWLAAGGSALEVTAAVMFPAIILVTWRRAGKRLEFYDYYILSALAWFVVQAVYESVYLSATAAASGEGLVRLVSTWQAPLRDIQIHGFALLMVLGVSQRIFHHFYALPEPSPRLGRAALVLLNLAVVGEVTGLLLMKLAGHGWAAVWYVSVLTLTITAAVLVKSWRIFSPAEDTDRSLKFLRAAYIWLFVSLVMLCMLPAYQYGLLARFSPDSPAATLGFSHAYYGATRHAITVGFISLMIVGVAAKVVPTLNGVSSSVLTRLWAPFVLLNLGCTLRVVGQTLTDFYPAAFGVAGVSGLFEVAGLALWAAHLWRVMAGKARQRLPKSGMAGRTWALEAPISGGLTVGQILDRYPALLETFLQYGFTMLTNPQLRGSIARVVTVDRACRRMGVDDEQFLAELNRRRSVYREGMRT